MQGHEGVAHGENVRQEWYAKDAPPVVRFLCAAVQDEASPIRLKQLIQDSDAQLITILRVRTGVPRLALY
jgi:hypothetical protein